MINRTRQKQLLKSIPCHETDVYTKSLFDMDDEELQAAILPIKNITVSLYGDRLTLTHKVLAGAIYYKTPYIRNAELFKSQQQCKSELESEHFKNLTKRWNSYAKRAYHILLNYQIRYFERMRG